MGVPTTVGGLFVLWTGFSFLAHWLGRGALRSVATSMEDRLVVGRSAVFLTFVQLFVGATGLFVVGSYVDESRGRSSRLMKCCWTWLRDERLNSFNWRLFACLVLYNVYANVCTNVALRHANPGMVFLVKTLEPVVSCVLRAFLVSGAVLKTSELASLPLIVTGAYLLYPERMGRMHASGLCFAFLSNVFFSMRNLIFKGDLVDADHQPTGTVRKIDLQSFMNGYGGIVLLPVFFVSFLLWPFVGRNEGDFVKTLHLLKNSQFLVLAVASGICHAFYSAISLLFMLRLMPVVGHSVANLLKRLVIAWLFYLAYGLSEQATGAALVHLAGLLLLVSGLVLFMKPRFVDRHLAENCKHIFLAILLTILLGFSSYRWTRDMGLPFSTTSLSRPKWGQSKPSEVVHGSPKWPFKTRQKLDMMEALSINLTAFPDKADFISKQLEYAEDVVLEAQRIHRLVFSDLFRGYHRAILVNVFTWANKGDQLITIGERIILQQHNVSLLYHCYYPGDDCKFNSEWAEDKKLVVLIQGAGYIGHPAHLPIVQRTIETFRGSRVVVFPISVCYPTPGCTDIVAYNQVFRFHPDLHVLLRDRVSFEKALRYFPQESTRKYLVPDSAFAVGSIRAPFLPSYDVIWLKRNDWENFGDMEHDGIPRLPDGLRYLVQDWEETFMKEEGVDFFEAHQLDAWAGVLYLARGRVVITDRLHAHLMSTLLGLPNVVQNSQTLKQQNYYLTWEASLRTSVLVNTSHHAAVKALQLMRKFPR